MDDPWSLGWGFSTDNASNTNITSPPKPHHHQNRSVGLFIDLSNIWVKGTRWKTHNKLSVIVEDLNKLALDFTTHDSVDMRQSVVISGQLAEHEENSLESLRFYTDQVKDESEVFEVMSNAILIWLWDQALSKQQQQTFNNSKNNDRKTPELEPCVTLVTSNPKFGPLIAKLRRRGVFVLLVTELSGSGIREPVPYSLRKDASVLYDWNEVCLILERFGAKTEQKDDKEHATIEEIEQQSTNHQNSDSRIENEVTHSSTSSSPITTSPNHSSQTLVSQQHACLPPLDLHSVPPLDMQSSTTSREIRQISDTSVDSDTTYLPFAFDSVPSTPQLENDENNTKSEVTTNPSSSSSSSSSSLMDNNEDNLQLNIEDHEKVIGENDIGKPNHQKMYNVTMYHNNHIYNNKNHNDIAAHLISLAIGQHDKLTNSSSSTSSSSSSSSVHANVSLEEATKQLAKQLKELEAGWAIRSVEKVFKSIKIFTRAGFDLQPYLRRLMSNQRIATKSTTMEDVAVVVQADLFEFVLELVRALYDRYRSLISSGNSPAVERRGAEKLDAANTVISALEGCEIGELTEELHVTAVDLAHSLLDHAPALQQADRLLSLVGVPDHLELVLMPYVDKWLRSSDVSASSQAYNFAYRYGLMDRLLEKHVKEALPLAANISMMQRQLQLSTDDEVEEMIMMNDDNDDEEEEDKGMFPSDPSGPPPELLPNPPLIPNPSPTTSSPGEDEPKESDADGIKEEAKEQQPQSSADAQQYAIEHESDNVDGILNKIGDINIVDDDEFLKHHKRESELMNLNIFRGTPITTANWSDGDNKTTILNNNISNSFSNTSSSSSSCDKEPTATNFLTSISNPFNSEKNTTVDLGNNSTMDNTASSSSSSSSLLPASSAMFGDISSYFHPNSTLPRVPSAESLSGLLLRAIEPNGKYPSFSEQQVESRVLALLNKHRDGLLGSDIPRFYWDEFGERLILPENPTTHERVKLKDFLLGIEGVGTYTKNTQPVFVAVAVWEDENYPVTPNVIPNPTSVGFLPVRTSTMTYSDPLMPTTSSLLPGAIVSPLQQHQLVQQHQRLHQQQQQQQQQQNIQHQNIQLQQQQQILQQQQQQCASLQSYLPSSSLHLSAIGSHISGSSSTPSISALSQPTSSSSPPTSLIPSSSTSTSSVSPSSSSSSASSSNSMSIPNGGVGISPSVSGSNGVSGGGARSLSFTTSTTYQQQTVHQHRNEMNASGNPYEEYYPDSSPNHSMNMMPHTNNPRGVRSLILQTQNGYESVGSQRSVVSGGYPSFTPFVPQHQQPSISTRNGYIGGASYGMVGGVNHGGGVVVDQGLVRLRIVAMLKGHDGILGAQLPSKYLETYGSALYLEASDGAKIKLKEYLLSDEMMQLLANYQGERLRLVLVKAGHDRKYSIVNDP